MGGFGRSPLDTAGHRRRQIQEIVDAAAQDFDAFYAQPCPEEIEQHAAAKPIQVLTFDGKGVVMRKEALREETRKRAEANVPKATLSKDILAALAATRFCKRCE